jgi:divalent metal cation (Fe/Co/Zn/Cd) transporter
LGWNAIEAAVAVGSGIVAGSVALVGFGLDSAIELVGATVVLVHLRAVLAGAEPNVAWQRQALRTIAVTFFALAGYRMVDATVTLVRGDRPSASPLGLVVTGAALVVMPILAWAKRRTAMALGGHD